MESLRELYKIGVGPSSSHTMGPRFIAQKVKKLYPQCHHFRVILYGSLALTGKGHLTDVTIEDVFKDAKVEFIWKKMTSLPFHPNGIQIEPLDEQGNVIETLTYYSIGGGSVLKEGEYLKIEEVYREKNLEEIMKICLQKNLSFYQYVQSYEPQIDVYLREILKVMLNSVERGLMREGKIPGKLQLERVAGKMRKKALESDDPVERKNMLLSAYAYAVSEENASGKEVVTAPTCGACGIVPALLYYAKYEDHHTDEQLIEALAVGGVFGNVVKKNATISGADGGCQAEVGTACAMGAAIYSSLLGLDVEAISYAAEMALEHNLGLTCDPVGGYVQIPCIERNGFGALRAKNAAYYAKQLSSLRKNRISFDMVVQVMKETGQDLNYYYKETSLGGLAKKLVIPSEE